MISLPNGALMEYVSDGKSLTGIFEIMPVHITNHVSETGEHAFRNCFMKQEKQNFLLRICYNRRVSGIVRRTHSPSFKGTV